MDYIDFINPGTRCSECHRPLTAISAIFSNNVNLGPSCAQKRGINKNEIPNLTKGIIQENTTNNETKSENSMIKREKTVINDKYISYLIIRVEKLKDIKKLQYKPIDDLYQKYCNNIFNKDDYQYLKNIINKSNKEYPIFSEDNIYFCYAVKNKLKLLLKQKYDKHLNNILSYLLNYANLSETQFKAIDNDTLYKIKYFDYKKIV